MMGKEKSGTVFRSDPDSDPYFFPGFKPFFSDPDPVFSLEGRIRSIRGSETLLFRKPHGKPKNLCKTFLNQCSVFPICINPI